jgi:pimeloyl-ACP methyl ester carboxylesterase
VPADRTGYSIDHYADLIAALVADLGTGPVVVVGLSMGGNVALAVARRHPEVLAGLVLADTRPDPDTSEGCRARTDHQTLVEQKGDVMPLVDGLLDRILAEASPRRPEAELRLRPIMRSTAPAGWIGALEAMKGRSDQTDLLTAIAVPALVVVGERDVIAPVAIAEAMARAIPEARLEVVAGAGHVANLENPEVFNRALVGFLDWVAVGSAA